MDYTNKYFCTKNMCSHKNANLNYTLYNHQIFEDQKYSLLHAICLLVAHTSSIVNPIMYGWFNSNFRKAFRELLGLPLSSVKPDKAKDLNLALDCVKPEVATCPMNYLGSLAGSTSTRCVTKPMTFSPTCTSQEVTGCKYKPVFRYSFDKRKSASDIESDADRDKKSSPPCRKPILEGLPILGNKFRLGDQNIRKRKHSVQYMFKPDKIQATSANTHRRSCGQLSLGHYSENQDEAELTRPLNSKSDEIKSLTNVSGTNAKSYQSISRDIDF